MEVFGFLFEFMFLGLGIYLYLFALGKIKSKDAERAAKAEEWRQKNHGWLRLAALALIAICAVNIFMHIRQIL
ncbi:MAG: hypothetical protein HKN16_01600 [Saprospiraceae bacterium]|nr:hypothetical protein [Saprospiraceae bacterium]